MLSAPFKHYLRVGVLSYRSSIPRTSSIHYESLLLCRSFAGHSKWSNIKHKKGRRDKAQASILGKASKAIISASRDCNGDLTDMRLQSAIAHAKAAQLPKDRIEHAIDKGIGSRDSAAGDLMNLRFDAMMSFESHKVAVVIKALTDNHKRTTSEVKNIVKKSGGESLTTDTLSYVFRQVGLVLVQNVEDEDSLFECALEAGAENVEPEDGEDGENSSAYTVTTGEKDLWQVVTYLRDKNFDVSQFEHRYILVDQEHGGVSLSPEAMEKLENFLEKLDENEDVSNVFHNAL